MKVEVFLSAMKFELIMSDLSALRAHVCSFLQGCIKHEFQLIFTSNVIVAIGLPDGNDYVLLINLDLHLLLSASSHKQ